MNDGKYSAATIVKGRSSVNCGGYRPLEIECPEVVAVVKPQITPGVSGKAIKFRKSNKLLLESSLNQNVKESLCCQVGSTIEASHRGVVIKSNIQELQRPIDIKTVLKNLKKRFIPGMTTYEEPESLIEMRKKGFSWLKKDDTCTNQDADAVQPGIITYQENAGQQNSDNGQLIMNFYHGGAAESITMEKQNRKTNGVSRNGNLFVYEHPAQLKRDGICFIRTQEEQLKQNQRLSQTLQINNNAQNQQRFSRASESAAQSGLTSFRGGSISTVNKQQRLSLISKDKSSKAASNILVLSTEIDEEEKSIDRVSPLHASRMQSKKIVKDSRELYKKDEDQLKEMRLSIEGAKSSVIKTLERLNIESPKHWRDNLVNLRIRRKIINREDTLTLQQKEAVYNQIAMTKKELESIERDQNLKTFMKVDYHKILTHPIVLKGMTAEAVEVLSTQQERFNQTMQLEQPQQRSRQAKQIGASNTTENSPSKKLNLLTDFAMTQLESLMFKSKIRHTTAEIDQNKEKSQKDCSLGQEIWSQTTRPTTTVKFSRGTNSISVQRNKIVPSKIALRHTENPTSSRNQNIFSQAIESQTSYNNNYMNNPLQSEVQNGFNGSTMTNPYTLNLGGRPATNHIPVFHNMPNHQSKNVDLTGIKNQRSHNRLNQRMFLKTASANNRRRQLAFRESFNMESGRENGQQ